MASAEVDLAAPVLTQREMLNLTWSHRWRLHETATASTSSTRPHESLRVA